MKIKTVIPKDYDEIYNFVKEAFKTAEVSDGTEQDFVNTLRESANYLPELDFAAYNDENELIGHILLTKFTVKTNKPVNAVLVAPLSIKANYRKQGFGGCLLKHALKTAAAHGYNAAFLLGNPDYYGRFGFYETSQYNIKNISDVPDKYVLACELTPGIFANIKGTIKII